MVGDREGYKVHRVRDSVFFGIQHLLLLCCLLHAVDFFQYPVSWLLLTYSSSCWQGWQRISPFCPRSNKKQQQDMVSDSFPFVPLELECLLAPDCLLSPVCLLWRYLKTAWTGCKTGPCWSCLFLGSTESIPVALMQRFP